MPIQVFSDTFTEASNTTLGSHVPTLGSGWASYVTSGGSNTLQVNATNDTVIRQVGSTSDGVIYAAIATPIFKNIYAQVTATVAESSDDVHYLAVRIQLTSGTFYVLRFNASAFRIGRFLNSSFSWLTSDLGAGQVANGDVVKLEAIGTTIKAYVNDVELLSVENSEIDTNGLAGYGMGQMVQAFDDMDLQEVDNFEVWAYGGSVTFTMDAMIKEVHTATFTTDGIIKATNTKTFTADAIVKTIITTTFTADGIIFARATTTFTVDAIMFATNTSTFTIDGNVRVVITNTFTIDGIVKGFEALSFTIDALVIGEGFYLSSVQLKRPKTFSREFIFQKTDYTAINGKSLRDTSSRKRKYMLGYERLTKTEVDTLMSIINLNESVQFQIRGQAFTDINTFVFPFIGGITYDIVGSDYLASLSLELIEEDA